MPLNPHNKIAFPYTITIWCETNKRWEEKTFRTLEEYLQYEGFGTGITEPADFSFNIGDLPPCTC